MISFEHVQVTYPGTDKPAVKDFSYTVPTGTTTALVGSSGSGKTTLLRCINRMVTPTAGRVCIDGEDIADRDPVALRRSIGYVIQNSGLLPHRSVLDNITTVPRLCGEPKDAARARALELMDILGLDRALASRYPGELSGGQAQRVGVARALAHDPNILLMDEPFGAIDPLVRRDLQDEILNLQRKLNKTIVFVTHDIDEAFLLADNIVLLEKGGVIAQAGSADELITKPASDFVADFVGARDRQVTIEKRGNDTVVVDRNGRVTGLVS
ncbi:ABC transporter ATP-binding protein [Corynebacterium aquilae]|uniref:ABC-type quaternary amine transporter n=1 Tax=Corynebacterium aquilae DSM 44791 TaxID=1431546 RepID=A0A1L7CIH1_9CORY|nr:ATP-binding cassette domain-containing protein [Corynebacterium aquilae]APT85573.1 ABC transporter ATP-binding protein [Corynebacterium aquilae DSM 44791]